MSPRGSSTRWQSTRPVRLPRCRSSIRSTTTSSPFPQDTTRYKDGVLPLPKDLEEYVDHVIKFVEQIGLEPMPLPAKLKTDGTEIQRAIWALPANLKTDAQIAHWITG